MTGTLVPMQESLPARMVTLLRNLPQRWRERAFWITQAGVVGVTLLHIVSEAWAETAAWTIPSAFHHIPVILYLGPISYASLRFGTEGAVLTGLWSALLTLPNVVIWHRDDFEWFELAYVLVVIAAGTLVSLPVEQERRQRRRAEATSQRLALLNSIATLTLTADLRTTLHETSARLVDMLGIDAACVAVTDRREAGEQLVVACHPGHESAGGDLTACLRERTAVDGIGPVASEDGVVILPLSAELPGSGADGRVTGYLAVKVAADRSLGEEDHRLLDSVANHLAVAIANERLTESERNRLRTYAMLVTRAQEEERKRVARELHDEAAQNVIVMRRDLAALLAQLGTHPATAALRRLDELARHTVDGIRRFSRDLRPPTLDELGLSSALDQLVTEVGGRSGLSAELRITGHPRRLPIETELAVFRIGQAALHNVERHADADRVVVDLAFGPESVRLDLTDDGDGFEVPTSTATLVETGRLGLLGMHERAELVGGKVQIHSTVGEGTRVTVEAPG